MSKTTLTYFFLSLIIFTGHHLIGQPSEQIKNYVDEIYPGLEKMYLDLHQSPELSLQEKKTARKMSDNLKGLGFEVKEGFGAHNLAAIYKNGPGPVVLIRTDMDALPVTEKTGLEYASTTKGTNAAGDKVGVMHACGHDMHMTVFTGTARTLIRLKDQWQGTLVMVAQSAEEKRRD